MDSTESISPSTSSSKAFSMRAPSRTPVHSASATTRPTSDRSTGGSSPGGPVLRSSRRQSHDTPPSGTPEVPLCSRLRRLMPRPKSRMTGGTTALTASVKRKPPLLSLKGLVGPKIPPSVNQSCCGYSFLWNQFLKKKEKYLTRARACRPKKKRRVQNRYVESV
jgi:hypothetical protein